MKKIFALGMMVLLAMGLLAGCGQQAKDTAKADTPKKIVVGLDDNYPPMSASDTKLNHSSYFVNPPFV